MVLRVLGPTACHSPLIALAFGYHVSLKNYKRLSPLNLELLWQLQKLQFLGRLRFGLLLLQYQHFISIIYSFKGFLLIIVCSVLQNVTQPQ